MKKVSPKHNDEENFNDYFDLSKKLNQKYGAVSKIS
jgi:hypothetical protein